MESIGILIRFVCSVFGSAIGNLIIWYTFHWKKNSILLHMYENTFNRVRELEKMVHDFGNRCAKEHEYNNGHNNILRDMKTRVRVLEKEVSDLKKCCEAMLEKNRMAQ